MSIRRIVTTGFVVTTALTTPMAALARPGSDGAIPSRGHTGTGTCRHHSAPACYPITFTNPRGRSRGPGAGAGLL